MALSSSPTTSGWYFVRPVACARTKVSEALNTGERKIAAIGRSSLWKGSGFTRIALVIAAPTRNTRTP